MFGVNFCVISSIAAFEKVISKGEENTAVNFRVVDKVKFTTYFWSVLLHEQIVLKLLYILYSIVCCCCLLFLFFTAVLVHVVICFPFRLRRNKISILLSVLSILPWCPGTRPTWLLTLPCRVRNHLARPC